MLKSGTVAVLALFSEAIFVCRRLSAPSLATAECSLFMDMRERQHSGLCQDEGSSGREFKVQFTLHIRFIASSEVCSSESTVVSLRRFVTSLSRLQGSH